MNIKVFFLISSVLFLAGNGLAAAAGLDEYSPSSSSSSPPASSSPSSQPSSSSKANGDEKFDCPTACVEGAQTALAKCRENHQADSAYCPKDDGSIPSECKKICDQLIGLSPQELQKKLPSNYRDIIEGN